MRSIPGLSSMRHSKAVVYCVENSFVSFSSVYLVMKVSYFKRESSISTKITLNHRKLLLQSSQSKKFLKKAFVSERNEFQNRLF